VSCSLASLRCGHETLGPAAFHTEVAFICQDLMTDPHFSIQGSLRLFGFLGRYEHATSVFQNGQGAKSLSQTRTDHLSTKVVPPEPSQGSRSLVETHNHTDNNNDGTTHSRISKPDVNRGDITGRTQQVITPDGRQQRYRPSDKPTLQERRQEGGVIEQKHGFKWEPVKGANTNLNNPFDHRNWTGTPPTQGQ
jgi:hypothetical protein